jgi:hypothetical protein
MHKSIDVWLEQLKIVEQNTRRSRPLMEPERPLPHSQEPVNEIYREPV